MKKVLALLLAAVMALAVAGCSGSGNRGQGGEIFETAKVKVAFMPNIGSAGLLVAAKEKGYFQEMGLQVELVEFPDGPAEIEAMNEGRVDICQIGHGAHALCIEGQARVFHLDSTSLADSVIGNVERGVETIADLRGRKVASCPGTSAEIILELALESEDMTLDDVEVVEMQVPDMLDAMLNGQVDACAGWTPTTYAVLRQMGKKAVRIASNNDFVDKVSFPSSFVTSEDFEKDHSDVLVRFSRALLKAQNYREPNIIEVARMVAKQCDLDQTLIEDTVGRGDWLTGDDIARGLADGTVKKYYEKQQQIFIDKGLFKKTVPVENYVALEIMQEAVDKMERYQ